MATTKKTTVSKGSAYLKGKVVLITGGTGTFGHAFVGRLLRDNQIKKLIVLSRDEFKQHNMQQQMPDPHNKLRFFLGDIRDKERLIRAFQGVDVVVHAAALKQVPAIEYNPTEAIKTNIDGSQNVFDAALANNVKKVLLVSSDKAVQPINLYGATKFAAEKLCVASNAYRNSEHNTAFSVVRYGNVVGSRGSFIEMIEKQRGSGVITLTDERMTRFWITIDRVMDVILDTLSLMQGGEIFIPKMKNLSIVDVIKLLTPESKIKTIGMRPGEKLHEVLITEYEAPRTYDVGSVYVVSPEFSWGNTTDWLKKEKLAKSDFIFASNNPIFQLSLDEARKILVLKK